MFIFILLVEFFTDVGVFGPSPEELLLFVFGVGAFEFEPVAFDAEAIGEEVAVTEAADVGAELAEASPTGFGVKVE